MKQIFNKMQGYTPATATSENLYFIAGQLVVKYQTINSIKAEKPAISECFGHYKEILSRCKELIKAGWDSKKTSVLSGFNYSNVLACAWNIAQQDSHFAALCEHAKENGLFVSAEDFVNRFYPHINKAGQPLCRQTYTNGLYKWSEWSVKPLDKFTDVFALQAIKASLRYYYDSVRNTALNKQSRVNETATDVPVSIKWLDTDCTKEIDLSVAVECINSDKQAGNYTTIKEWTKTHQTK